MCSALRRGFGAAVGNEVRDRPWRELAVGNQKRRKDARQRVQRAFCWSGTLGSSPGRKGGGSLCDTRHGVWRRRRAALQEAVGRQCRPTETLFFSVLLIPEHSLIFVMVIPDGPPSTLDGFEESCRCLIPPECLEGPRTLASDCLAPQHSKTIAASSPICACGIS